MAEPSDRRIAKLEQELEKLEEILESGYDDPTVDQKTLSKSKQLVQQKKKEIAKEKQKQANGGNSSKDSCCLM